MTGSLVCGNDARREHVRKCQKLNGLDYLEVGPVDQVETSLENQSLLRVYFLGKAPVELDSSNVRIEGGRRISDIRTKKVEMYHYRSVELDDYMEVYVDRPGDFSTYTLRVVERDEQGRWVPHSAFDPRYDRVDFSFKVDCPGDFDCGEERVCPLEPLEEPDINYLAKDYASFRQLILDRLALVMPDWKERHVPDIGVALVEVFAYIGDHLSYYQDAVATEAYLDTARQRISVRRHARLVDYKISEGCNSRAWLSLVTDRNLSLEPDEIYFVTAFDKGLKAAGKVIFPEELPGVSTGIEFFEPVSRQKIQLYSDNSRLLFYTWGNRECCIPKGATRATLKGKPGVTPGDARQLGSDGDTRGSVSASLNSASPPSSGTADLPYLPYIKPGDVLIFEEVIGPKTGHPGDADPKHRHPIRLTTVEAGLDPLNGQPVVEIGWADEDALPFPLCLSSLGPPPGCRLLENVSVAWGNVILVDHGRSRVENLATVPDKEIIGCCKGEGVPADTTVIPGYFRPSLQHGPLTFSQPIANEGPASTLLKQDVREALPQIALLGESKPAGNSQWTPKNDLLEKGPDDHHFVAEIDNEGRAHLRFGNDEFGKQPDAGTKFQAAYRTGNGFAGNVGAEAISHLVSRNTSLNGVTVHVRNPMPAQGGTPPEPIAEAKLFAPNAFKKELKRAITADDYAAIAQREFREKVQRAAARLRWTGSWYEVLVAVDPFGKEEAGPELLDAITRRLHRYRRIGHDLVVKAACRVPLDIVLLICVRPHYLRGHIKSALLSLFSNRLLPDGRRGFFHVDNLTFGDDIHLSRLVATAQSVAGVESVQVTKLKRLNEQPRGEIESGVLPLGPFEIARLDNDPGFPENGKLTLDLRGGR